MKLDIQMVPGSAWGVNLWSILSHKIWMDLSHKIRYDKNFFCDICGSKNTPANVHAHEVWKWEKVSPGHGKQVLEKIECCCKMCHDVHHWGRSMSTGMNMKVLTEYAIDVNGCTKEEWNNHIRSSFMWWDKASDVKWFLDVKSVEDCVEKIYPGLFKSKKVSVL